MHAKGLVEIDDVAAEIIRRIADMYLDGAGVNKIAKTSTFENVPTPSARAQQLVAEEGRTYKRIISDKWTGSQISKLLDDDFYVGVLRTGKYKRQGINGKDVRTPVEDQSVFEDHHPVILSKETFEALRRRRHHVRDSKYRGEKKGATLYHGLLFCGDCGARMYTYKNQSVKRQYICSSHFKYPDCS